MTNLRSSKGEKCLTKKIVIGTTYSGIKPRLLQHNEFRAPFMETAKIIGVLERLLMTTWRDREANHALGLVYGIPFCLIIFRWEEGRCRCTVLDAPSFPSKKLKGVQRHYYRVGSHLKFQTVQNETFRSVPEVSGTYRSSSDVKSISSMTSEDFSKVY